MRGRPAPAPPARGIKARPLWICPKCGHAFVKKNQYHACRRHTLDDVFGGKPPQIRRLFERFRALVERCGPVRLLPYRDNVVFMVRVRFAGATPKASWLDIGLWLTRRIDHPRCRRIETLYPHEHIHSLRITRSHELDRPARRLGARSLRRRPPRPSALTWCGPAEQLPAGVLTIR